MTIERYFELQDKLLCLENALQHYGMDKEAKEAHCIVDDLFVIINENDTNDVENRCLKFLKKYKHIRDKFDSED